MWWYIVAGLLPGLKGSQFDSELGLLSVLLLIV